jgi:hypothetical protein
MILRNVLTLRNVFSARNLGASLWLFLYHNQRAKGSYYLLRYCFPLVISWTSYPVNCSQWMFSRGRNGMVHFSFASPDLLAKPLLPCAQGVDPYWLWHQCYVLWLLVGLPREW